MVILIDETQVLAAHGGTGVVVHAGTRQPGDGDIPVIGYLFRGEQTNKTKKNLIIFITPEIIRDSSQMKEIVVKELRNRKDRIESELLDIYGGDELEGGDVADAGSLMNVDEVACAD